MLISLPTAKGAFRGAGPANAEHGQEIKGGGSGCIGMLQIYEDIMVECSGFLVKVASSATATNRLLF